MSREVVKTNTDWNHPVAPRETWRGENGHTWSVYQGEDNEY